MKKNKIYVSICSRGFNNNLLLLLDSIYQNSTMSALNIKVLIAFNNSKKIDYLKKKLIKKKLKKIDFKIIYEKKKGISYVRNKSLNYLRLLNFNYCCFLDDDCIVRKNFLINHLNFIKKNNCNIVGGPQLYKSNRSFLKVFERKFKQGKKVFWVSTNNVFFKKSIFNNNLSFSHKVTKYGFGEDQLFFSKLAKSGEIIKWNNNPVYEVVQIKRDNFKWFMTRNYKYGLTSILIDRELYGYKFAFILNILKSVFNLLKSFLYLILIPIEPIKYFYQSLAFLSRFFGNICKILIFK